MGPISPKLAALEEPDTLQPLFYMGLRFLLSHIVISVASLMSLSSNKDSIRKQHSLNNETHKTRHFFRR